MLKFKCLILIGALASCVYAADLNSEPSSAGLTEGQIAKLLEENPVELIEIAKKHCFENYHDYKGTFIKQERVEGKLWPEQKMKFIFKAKPFSVYMDIFEGNGPADKILYVEGKHQGKMIVHPTGFVRFLKGSVRMDPHHRDVYKRNLYPVTRFGFCRTLDSMINIYSKAQRDGTIEAKYMGTKVVDGSKRVVFEVLLSTQSKIWQDRTRIEMDITTMMPMFIKSEDRNGKLLYRYEYEDIEFNVGLTSKDFEPQKWGL